MTRRLVLGVAVALVVAGVVWGRSVQADPNVKLGAAPFVGEWHARFGGMILVAALVAAVTVHAAPLLQYRAWLIAAPVLAVAFTFALAAADGFAHVLDPVVHPTEYWANLATLPPSDHMLRRYGTVEFLLDYSVHLKGHPPGFVLLLQGLQTIGLGAPWVTGALSYIGVAVVPVAVLATLKRLTSEVTAARVAPFLVVAPYAVWMGTSADAAYAALGAMGVLLMVVATKRPWVAVPAGLVLGALLFATYGAVVFLVLPTVLVIAVLRSDPRRLLRVVLGAAAGAAIVTIVFRLAGFWWFDGATTTRRFYWWGTAQFRPWTYFLVGNLAASIVAVGPGVVVAFSHLRNRRVWWMVGAALMCIAVADVSQYSKAEVERIWLLFFPWVVPAVAGLSARRRWIAVQAAVALGLQMTLVSKW